MGKLLYNIELWGHINKTLTTKLNKIMIKAANIITKFSLYGRTDEKILQEVGWLDFKSTVKAACYKLMFKLINSNEGNCLSI